MERIVDAVFGLFIAVFVIVVIGFGLYYLVNVLQETVTRQVTVVSKRIAVLQGQNGPQTAYYCTFEFEDGQRAEYSVGSKYGLMKEGGSRRIGYQRRAFLGLPAPQSRSGTGSVPRVTG